MVFHGNGRMDSLVTRANIDHYLNLLTGGELTASNRNTLNKLLIVEEDKLGHDLEQLEFAENRAAKSLYRVNHIKKLRDAFVEGSIDRAYAERVLANFEAIHTLMETFCVRIRERINSRL
jgi:hypothetical protein